MKGFKDLVSLPRYRIPPVASSDLGTVLAHLRQHLPSDVLVLTVDELTIAMLMQERDGGTMVLEPYLGKGKNR